MSNGNRLYSALAAVIALGAGSVHGQENGRPSAAALAPPSVYDEAAAAPGPAKITDLLGTPVLGEDHRKIGDIEDFVVADGAIVTAVVSVGGLLGFGGKLVGVPYSDLRMDIDGRSLVLALNAAQLEAMPAFDDHIAAAAQVQTLMPEPVAPLEIDEDLAEIDPRLAEGIAASEQAYGEKLDHESYDNEKSGSDDE